MVSGPCMHMMLKLVKRILHKSKLLLACQGGLVHPLQLQAEGLENFKGHTCTRLFGIILLTSKEKSHCDW